jgi:phage shock protein C
MMKKLTRNRDDKWLGGVCGGIADYTGLDANLIRLLVAIATILGLGSLIVAYVVAWILIPAGVPAAQQTVWAGATDVPTTPSGPAQPSA